MDIGSHLSTETIAQAAPFPPVCIEAHVPIRVAFETLRDLGRGAILVCRNGILAGIFTERDALRILASGKDLESPIESGMKPNPLVIQESESIEAAISRMAANGYRRLPIVDSQGRPTGLLDAVGIIHWLVEHFPSEVYNLPPVAKPRMQEREGP